MSHISTELTLETIRMLSTLKCVARYDFIAEDGEVYYLSDYEFGKGKHLHVCLLNVPDSEFRITPLEYLTIQPRNSWYVNDTKIDTESEIGPQLADTMCEWLNSNPWKEFTSFDSVTGLRLSYGVEKIKHHACCGCTIGSHAKNPEEYENHKDSLTGATAALSHPATEEPHPSNGGVGEDADQTAADPDPDISIEKEKEIPQYYQSTVQDASYGSAPQGMMLINMDLVPLEHRDFVAQWCNQIPANTEDREAI